MFQEKKQRIHCRGAAWIFNVYHTQNNMFVSIGIVIIHTHKTSQFFQSILCSNLIRKCYLELSVISLLRVVYLIKEINWVEEDITYHQC
jgi:hypothetical protein